MYRFRSIENLLGKYKELENQEIYFAAPDELNDPMEGFKEFIWSGDEIVWNNLLSHYLRCLEHVYALNLLLDDSKPITRNDIPILINRKSYPSTSYRELHKDIKGRFLNDKNIKSLVSGISSRKTPIARNELALYVKLIHPFALDVITEVYSKHDIIDKPLFTGGKQFITDGRIDLGDFFRYSNELEKEFPNEARFASDVLYTSVISTFNQSDLLRKYNQPSETTTSNYFFLLNDFPEEYTYKLDELVFPNWYTASFIGSCNNSTVWAHYGDKHTGVCLRFKTTTKEGHDEINLLTTNSYSSGGGYGVDMIPHRFHKVVYDAKHVEIDFFKSLGRNSAMALRENWFKNENGDYSNCGDYLKKENQKRWHQEYWNSFIKSTTVKLTDWVDEDEYRLVINENLIDYSDKKKRKLRYDFNDLEGIVFGLKTRTNDKIAIMKVIEQKCKEHGRKEFDFYQAHYSNKSNKIEAQKLNLLKFE